MTSPVVDMFGFFFFKIVCEAVSVTPSPKRHLCQKGLWLTQSFCLVSLLGAPVTTRRLSKGTGLLLAWLRSQGQQASITDFTQKAKLQNWREVLRITSAVITWSNRRLGLDWVVFVERGEGKILAFTIAMQSGIAPPRLVCALLPLTLLLQSRAWPPAKGEGNNYRAKSFQSLKVFIDRNLDWPRASRTIENYMCMPRQIQKHTHTQDGTQRHPPIFHVKKRISRIML